MTEETKKLYEQLELPIGNTGMSLISWTDKESNCTGTWLKLTSGDLLELTAVTILDNNTLQIDAYGDILDEDSTYAATINLADANTLGESYRC